jgi:hypothetical protein
VLALHRFSIVAAVTAGGLFALPSPVSDPVGVYAVIDRVVVEGDTANPRAIQLWGSFAISNGKSGDNYLPAQAGYLYYTLNPTNQRATMAEWRDLRTVAGAKTLIGFGGRYEKNGRVRAVSERPTAPDVYPLGWSGIVKAQNHLAPQIARELLALPRPVPPKSGR